MQVEIQGDMNGLVRKAAAILRRVVAERTAPRGGRDHEERSQSWTVSLEVDKCLPTESFKIEKLSEDHARVVGGDGAGVLYGCGKLLRLAELSPGRAVLHGAPELDAPAKPDRGMYFAVHNYNTYQVAPADFIVRYIEDMALWGFNDISVLFHKFYFEGIADSKVAEYVERLNLILRTAKSLGMKTTLLMTANDGYANVPETLLYHGKTPRNWGTEICVSNPEGMAALRREFEEIFDALEPLDQVVLWPYDSGGCGCAQCAPWGAKGFFKVAKVLGAAFRRKSPNGKIYLSTWYYDYNCGEVGEWDALFAALERGELDWADGVMADGAYVNGFFPRQVVERNVGKPVISFMEISMVTGRPWGGFGSNAIPAFIQKEWNRSKDHVIGGLPYSEGVYEDINKVLWAQLCWSPDRPAMDILEEYAAAEFSHEHARAIAAAIASMEPSRIHDGTKLVNDFSGAAKAWDAISLLDRCLGWNERNSWRWRQVLLRAKIDAELAASGGGPTAELGRAYDELFRIYQLQERSFSNVRPVEVVAGEKGLEFLSCGKSLMDFPCFRRTVATDGFCR